jgi:hypothetical protein
MPWLPVYADRQDIEQVIALLNADGEAAFIVPVGPRQWRAVERLEGFADGRYCIWCHSGGGLPLIRPKGKRNGVVRNPWAGWTEEVTGMDPDTPYFGPGHPTVIWFDIRTPAEGVIRMSSFEWIGNHYRVLGSAAPAAVEKWWQRLKRAVTKSAKRIPRTGPVSGPRPEIWALPSAYAKIGAGAPRTDNPI